MCSGGGINGYLGEIPESIAHTRIIASIASRVSCRALSLHVSSRASIRRTRGERDREWERRGRWRGESREKEEARETRVYRRWGMRRAYGTLANRYRLVMSRIPSAGRVDTGVVARSVATSVLPRKNKRTAAREKATKFRGTKWVQSA